MTNPQNVPEETEIADDEATVGAAPTEDDDRAGLYGGWSYLGLLFVVFLLIALAAYGGGDNGGTASPGASPAVAAADGTPGALEPVALVMAVDGDTATLRGAVPDVATRDQLLALAQARYPDGTVVDELTTADGLTVEGGTIAVEGTTDEGDDRPEGLVADVQAALGLVAGSFDVTFVPVVLRPLEADAVVGPDGVSLTGAVPDTGFHDALLAAAEAQWGVGNVDSSGLTVDAKVTVDGGRLRITGVADAGDIRPTRFAEALAALGVETSEEVEIDTSGDALGRLEVRLRDQLSANPILFALGSADIDPASDQILRDAAAAINAAPGISVEIVGHTDSTGRAEANLELSKERAAAVMARLIELGVDAGRLTARGAGDTEPVADNDTEEGRAANRRIAFEFEGATDQVADQATDQEEE